MKVNICIPFKFFIGKIEEQIAGNAEERALMMPLHYIDSFRDKAEIEVRKAFTYRMIYRARLKSYLRTIMRGLAAPRKML